MSWHEFKEPVVTALGMSHDAAHVVLGGMAFGLVFLLLRTWPMAAVVAWLVVLAIEVLNEIGDAVDWIGWTGTVNWLETVKDLLLTMLVPTVALLIGRLLRRESPPAGVS